MSTVPAIWIGPFTGWADRDNHGIDLDLLAPGSSVRHMPDREAETSAYWAWMTYTPGAGYRDEAGYLVGAPVNVEPSKLGLDASGQAYVDAVAGPAAGDEAAVSASGGAELVRVSLERP